MPNQSSLDVLIWLATGIIIGIFAARQYYEEKAIEHNAAHYDKAGEFQWNK